MAEEFQESEVIFHDHNFEQNEDSSNHISSFSNSRNNNKRKKKTNTKTTTNISSSVPVSIPENASMNPWLRYMDQDLDGGDDEFVPPHVIVGRRVAGKMMAFSVCTGNGRTLKGRDLSQVRNSVLRMTGFLET